MEDIACPICLLDFNSEERPQNERLKEELLSQKMRVYVTPCKHSFHPECLSTWIQNKAECPTCRAKVPMIDP